MVGIGILFSLGISMIGWWRRLFAFFLRLGSKKLFMKIDDKPRWEETKNGDFSTRAMYKLLEADSPYVFPSGNI